MEITEAMIRAARLAAIEVGFLSPYMARSADYDDLDELRAADADADRQNDEAMREVLAAAISAWVALLSARIAGGIDTSA